jgi:hypothetical protein
MLGPLMDGAAEGAAKGRAGLGRLRHLAGERALLAGWLAACGGAHALLALGAAGADALWCG